MIRRPPRFTLTNTLFPAPTLCRLMGEARRQLRAAFVERQAAHALVRRRDQHRPQRGLHRGPADRRARAAPRPRAWRHAELAVQRIVESRGRLEPKSEEHTSELQSLMRNSYAVFFLKKKTHTT